MKNLGIVLIAVCLLFCVNSCLAKDQPVDVDNKVCPVSGEKVDSMSGATTYEHQGKIYHFCCPMCIPTFKENPEKYIEIINKEKA